MKTAATASGHHPASKRHGRRLACAAFLALSLASAEGHADAGEIKETLNVVWEVFWQQQGYLQYVSKWHEPIRVKFSGPSFPSHRLFALEQLQRVARVAGIEVAEADDAERPANLEVEIVRDDPVGRHQPCRAVRRPPAGVIRHVKITVGERSVRRCFLHEAMHAMGMPGHPYGGSILSYYRDANELTPADEFMLKVWYSAEVKPGMFPLPALRIFARRLVETVPEGEARLEAERIAAQFLREVIDQLESIALGKGEPPRIVFRSSTSTLAGLERGRTEAQFLVGMAYTYGHAIAVDHAKGAALLARAAVFSHREAQLHLGHAYRLGRGVDRDPVEAYKWYVLAAQNRSSAAKTEAGKLEQSLNAEDVAQGKSRAASWKPATRELPTTQTDQ